jgi:hypothetical protein
MFYRLKALFPIQRYNIQPGESFAVRSEAEYQDLIVSGLAESPDEFSTGTYETKIEVPRKRRGRIPKINNL